MIKLTQMALVFITAAILTAGSTFVFAEDQSAAVSATTGNGSADTVMSEKDFQAHKTKVLQRISDRLTKIQKIQDCVQAANDLKSMRACKPHEDKRAHANKQ